MLSGMLDSYLAQMERLARRRKADLADACLAAEVSYTTLWRWRKGHYSPSEETARKVMEQINRMGTGR